MHTKPPSQRLGSRFQHDRERQISRRRLLRDLLGATAGLAACGFLPASGTSDARAAGPSRRELASELEQVLWRRILPAWYPRALDSENGGFWESFARDWSRRPASSKFLVYQARMTWVPAAVSIAYPERGEPYLGFTRHGLRFLQQRMWDPRYGGFVDRADLAGRPDRETMPWKQMYSLAFGLFAAATSYEATGDAEARALAMDTFPWIDEHAHDSEQEPS